MEMEKISGAKMKYTLIIILLLLSLSCLFGQNLKIAYVNTDRILAGSNEANEIARVYDLDRQNWMNQIRDLKEEVGRMERDFDINKLTMRESAKKDVQQKIQTKKDQMEQMFQEYFGDNGRAEQRYKELIDPLTKKINDIIVKISKDEKYDLVLDVSMGTVLYADPKYDITDVVLAELNVGTQATGSTQKEETKGGEDKKADDKNQPPLNDTNKLMPGGEPKK